MTTHEPPRQRLKEALDLESVLAYLRDELDWPLEAAGLEELTFSYTPAELGLESGGETDSLEVRRLRPTSVRQPWAIFLVRSSAVRLPLRALRTVLRAFVRRRRASIDREAWNAEDMLFLCSHREPHGPAMSVVHFHQLGKERSGARLSSFGWTSDSNDRTVLEFSLPALRWPANVNDAHAWRAQWSAAFDKQSLTAAFFREYQAVFEILQTDLLRQSNDRIWAHDYALHFLNRCMLIFFLQRKRWLGNDPDFLRTYWNAYVEHEGRKDTFFRTWLSPLFLLAFNRRPVVGLSVRVPDRLRRVIDSAPYLNGGLFAESELDRKHEASISDARSEQVLTFLGRYNFTVREDTPLDQEVAVDAEMLGRVYESLVNLSEEADERGDAGIFYTPRVEIDLMCRQALVEYLAEGQDAEIRRSVRHAVFAVDADEKVAADSTLAAARSWPLLDSRLRELKVVDPACGSGAFLVGMLQVLDDLVRRANRQMARTESPQVRRRRIIRESLYGVDVMQWAVEVAELRLWLELLIETELHSEELGARPLLPNLSFNVRCGDALIQLLVDTTPPPGGAATAQSAALRHKLQSLSERKRTYFDGDPGSLSANMRAAIEEEEIDTLRAVLREHLQSLSLRGSSARAALVAESEDLFGSVRKNLEGTQRARMEASLKAAAQAAERIQREIQALDGPTARAFSWKLSFVEVFASRGGFDIVVGNPPYVRHEKIGAPSLLRREETPSARREYKRQLAQMAYAAFPSYFGFSEGSSKVDRPMGGKSDLYVYFFYRGLSILRPGGTLVFITSNAWLDAGYGATLQAFLLSEMRIREIVDNESQRSFANADINTVISVISKPGTDDHDERAASLVQFVLFKVPFEQGISAPVLDRIEQCTETLQTSLVRVLAVSQGQLLEEGSRRHTTVEPDESGEPAAAESDATLLEGSAYGGGKWGGRYLRAPEIYWVLMRKGAAKCGNLSTYFRGERYLNTGGADGFFVLTDVGPAKNGRRLVRNVPPNGEAGEFEGEVEDRYLIPLIKDSARDDRTICVSRGDAFCLVVTGTPTKRLQSYIEWGEVCGFHERSVTSGRTPWYAPTKQMLTAGQFLVPRSFGDRFIIHRNDDRLLSLRYYRLHKIAGREMELCGYLNSTLVAFFIETLGNKSLGQGVLDFFMADFLSMEIPIVLNPDVGRAIKKMESRPIGTVAEECGTSSGGIAAGHRRTIPEDRQALDDAVFEGLGLTRGEQEAVYASLVDQVRKRVLKAGSLDANAKRRRSRAVRDTLGIWDTSAGDSPDGQNPMGARENEGEAE